MDLGLNITVPVLYEGEIGHIFFFVIISSDRMKYIQLYM